MPENDSFWDFYWELRLQGMETLGKREAILAASRLVRSITETPGRPVRLLELGCGEGQIIGAVVEAHVQAAGIAGSTGVDYLPASIARCRRDYPSARFIEGDFTDPALLSGLGQFEIVLLVNALHEVFSAAFSPQLGEVDVTVAKQRVQAALAGAVERLVPGGYLLLFDGLEQPGELRERLRVRFLSPQARENFATFAREYRPFHVTYREIGPYRVELSRRDFNRYIDKSIFLGKALWETERLESYQYFTREEFLAAFRSLALTIRELRTFTVNEEKWSRLVEIETPGASFPEEHILIIAQKSE